MQFADRSLSGNKELVMAAIEKDPEMLQVLTMGLELLPKSAAMPCDTASLRGPRARLHSVAHFHFKSTSQSWSAVRRE